jgi:hypothetical protein
MRIAYQEAPKAELTTFFSQHRINSTYTFNHISQFACPRYNGYLVLLRALLSTFLGMLRIARFEEVWGLVVVHFSDGTFRREFIRQIVVTIYRYKIES